MNCENKINIGLAQIPVSKGDIEKNLDSHLNAIRQASENNTDIIVFPELSLTGYELELVAELAFLPEASNFEALSDAAMVNDVIVVAGCPLKAEDSSKPRIGAVICFPDGLVEFYSKQYLHAGEELYFSAGVSDYSFSIKGYQVALAICADFTNSNHVQRAKKLGADIYVVSALISETGFVPDAKSLGEIASKHRLPVLLSNHISNTGGWEACGKSSVWDPCGGLTVGDDSRSPGLVLCSISGNDIEVINKHSF